MQNVETRFNLIEHSRSGFKSGSSNADINQPKAKPWAYDKTFNPLLKERRRQTAFIQRISLRKVSMAKANATTNGREKIITLMSQLYHISDICNNFVTIMSLYYGQC